MNCVEKCTLACNKKSINSFYEVNKSSTCVRDFCLYIKVSKVIKFMFLCVTRYMDRRNDKKILLANLKNISSVNVKRIFS